MFSEPPPEEPDDDAFNEILSELTPLQQRLKKTPGLIFGAGVNGITVVTALLAWFVTPPIGRVAALGSLLGGGAAGRQVGKRLTAARRGLVPAAIADMVNEDGIGGLQPREVAALAERFQVSPEEFEQQLTAVYTKYLRQLLSEDQVVPAQIQELGMLRRGMGLRWNATEAAHLAEARAFLDGEAPPSEGAMPAELSALLWMSTGLFRTSKKAASMDELTGVLGLEESAAQRIVNTLSKPFYGRAVAKACGKFNRTTAPGILQTARQALCLSEDAAQQVHAEMYEGQLAVLLPEDSTDCTLGEEEMELLGELEGILQVRGAGAALRKRTEPLYRDALTAALSRVAAEGAAERPVAVWGKLALRQQQLNLPTDAAKTALVVESRRLATEQLTAAAELHAAGRTEEALAMAQRVLEYADFLGDMLTVAGLEGSDAGDLAGRYLGALSLPSADDAALQGLAAAMAAATPEAELLTASMFAMSDPTLAASRGEYTAALDACLATASFDASAAKSLADTAAQLGLPAKLAEQLARDVYYGWLTDLSERGDRRGLEGASQVRSALGVGAAATEELYETTEVDELVLTACADGLRQQGAQPLSGEALNELSFLEGQLAARAGVGDGVVRRATE